MGPVCRKLSGLESAGKIGKLYRVGKSGMFDAGLDRGGDAGRIWRSPTAAMLRESMSGRPLTVRFNLSRASEEAILTSLRSQKIHAEAVEGLAGVYRLSGYDSLSDIRAFSEGLFQVQDVSSVLAGLAASPKAGDHVLDVCAAPGGKSLHAADLLKGTGLVEARDLSDEKTDLIRDNIRRSRFENYAPRKPRMP